MKDIVKINGDYFISVLHPFKPYEVLHTTVHLYYGDFTSPVGDTVVLVTWDDWLIDSGDRQFDPWKMMLFYPVRFSDKKIRLVEREYLQR